VVCWQLFDNILLTLPRQTTSSTGKSPSQSVLELANDIHEKTPDVFDIEMVQSVIRLSPSVYVKLWFHVKIKLF